MTQFKLLSIYLALLFPAVNARRNQQNVLGSPNSGGSGSNYLRKTESNWQGQWFTGSCKSDSFKELNYYEKKSTTKNQGLDVTTNTFSFPFIQCVFCFKI